MGLKDLKLFPMEQISVTKIQGRTNTRHNNQLRYWCHLVSGSGVTSTSESACHSKKKRLVSLWHDLSPALSLDPSRRGGTLGGPTPGYRAASSTADCILAEAASRGSPPLTYCVQAGGGGEASVATRHTNTFGWAKPHGALPPGTRP